MKLVAWQSLGSVILLKNKKINPYQYFGLNSEVQAETARSRKYI
jgi:hypothetical protein